MAFLSDKMFHLSGISLIVTVNDRFVTFVLFRVNKNIEVDNSQELFLQTVELL